MVKREKQEEIRVESLKSDVVVFLRFRVGVAWVWGSFVVGCLGFQIQPVSRPKIVNLCGINCPKPVQNLQYTYIYIYMCID